MAPPPRGARRWSPSWLLALLALLALVGCAVGSDGNDPEPPVGASEGGPGRRLLQSDGSPGSDSAGTTTQFYGVDAVVPSEDAATAADNIANADPAAGYPVFSPGFPKATYRVGTNTFAFASALDRPGAVFFVVARQPNGGAAGSATSTPTPSEIFAGNLSGAVAADAAGTLRLYSPGYERDVIVTSLADEAIYDVYVVTHSDPDHAGSGGNGTTSPAFAMRAAVVIPDVTPPTFAFGTPYAVGNGPNYVTVAVASTEPGTVHVLILAADDAPPRSAGDVAAGTAPTGVKAVGVTSFAASVDAAVSVNLTGEMFPSEDYVVYVTLTDAATVPNTSPVVGAVAISTQTCTPCESPKVLASGTCSCVTPSTFTVELSTTATNFLNNKDVFRANIASQLGVQTEQVSVVGWGPSIQPGMLQVEVSVLPASETDVVTAVAVDTALLAANLSAPEELGGGDAALASIILPGAPETTILIQSRPGGMTSPITDDGRLPGFSDTVETSNRAYFEWTVKFGEVECTGCKSQCKVDQEDWVYCSSPYLIQDLQEGEHNFRVRGLGGDGTPDPTPDRFTWTVRFPVEIFFSTPPPANVNTSSISFNMSSNKDEAIFEYSLNDGFFPKYTRLPLGQNVVTVTSQLGANKFLARAVAEGETSASVARHLWVYDTYAPLATITSDTKNATKVNKETSIRFTLAVNDTEPTYLPFSDVAGVEVRFSRVSDGALSPAPLFDFKPAMPQGYIGRSIGFTLTNMSTLETGMYRLTARGLDKAGNLGNTDAPHGSHQYYFFLTDEVPTPATITPAMTLEDTITPVFEEDNATAVQLKVIPQKSLNGGTVDPVAYKVEAITGGQVFYPDGVTEVFDGDFVDAANATAGFRFLPSKDWYTGLVLPSGFEPEFAFTVRPSSSFNDSGVADVPAVANITVTNKNDPPTLDPNYHFKLTGVYVLDSVYTNFGDAVHAILGLGVLDIDGVSSPKGMAVLGADQTRGTWEWSKDGGDTWNPFGFDLAPDRPLLLHARGTQDRVRYVPERVGGTPTEDVAWSASFPFRAWDTSTGHETGTRGRWEYPDGGPVVGVEGSPPLGFPTVGSGASLAPPPLGMVAMGEDPHEGSEGGKVPAGGLDNFDGLFYGMDIEGLQLQGLGDASSMVAMTDGRAAALRAMGADGSISSIGAFYGLRDGLFDGLGGGDGQGQGGIGGGVSDPPKWVWFNASGFQADGSVSLGIGTAVVDVYGIEWSAYMRDNMGKTLSERRRVQSPVACPPPHGSAVAFDLVDGDAALVMQGTGTWQRPDPPWTVEAWVRRDAWLSGQVLTSSPDGSALMLDLSPATKLIGLVQPSSAAASAAADRDYATARNNTAANAAAARGAAAEASFKRFNYSAPIRRWVHLAFVALPEGMPYAAPYADVRLYVDGLYHGVVTGAGMPLPIGSIGGPGRSAFAIDEVRFWSVARAPAAVWAERGTFLSGSEPGLVSYLPLEEGCGRTTADLAAAAVADGRATWTLNGTNATWQRQKDVVFACATVSAVRPAVIPPRGGIELTLYGSGFTRPSPPLNATAGPSSLFNHTGKHALCRFGSRGGGGHMRTSPAAVVSAEVVTCVAPPAEDDGTKHNVAGSLPGGAVTVEFCDAAMSCCSDPAPLEVPPLRMRPANFTPSSILFPSPAEHNRVQYRSAAAERVWPRAAAAGRGAMLTITGWGFAAAEGSGPGQWGATWPFPVGGSGVDGDGSANRGGSIVADASCAFTVWGGGTPAGVRDNVGAPHAPPPPGPPPSSSPPIPGASPPGGDGDTTTSRVNPAAAARAGLAAAAGSASLVGIEPRARLTTPARVVSSAAAVCELPALPSSAAPPGSRVAVSVALVLNGGAHNLRAPATLLVAAPDAPGPSLRLDAAHVVRVTPPAPDPSRREVLPSEVEVAVVGRPEGGTAVVVTAPVADEGETRETVRLRSAFPPGSGGTVLGTQGFGKSGSWNAGRGLDGFPDAACGFGTIRPITARPVGARRAECIAPSAPDGSPRPSVPIAATLFASAGRYEDLVPTVEPGVGFKETNAAAALGGNRTVDFPGSGRVRFEWSAPSRAEHVSPTSLTVGSVSAGFWDAAGGREAADEIHVFGALLPGSSSTAGSIPAAVCLFGVAGGLSTGAWSPADDAEAAAALSVPVDSPRRRGAGGSLRCRTAALFTGGGGLGGFVPVAILPRHGLEGGAGGEESVPGHATGEVRPRAGPSGWRAGQPTIMIRADPLVASLGADPGPEGGGWVLRLTGRGFLPGDGCSLAPGRGRIDADGNRTADGWLLEGRHGEGGGTVPGIFVSTALVVCEAPGFVESSDVSHSVPGLAVVRLAVPAGWNGRRLVAGGGGGFAVFVPAAPGESVAVAAPAVLSLAGGRTLRLVTGANRTARPEVNGIGISRGSAPGSAPGWGGRSGCRVRAVDVAARDVDVGSFECATPATAGWAGSSATVAVTTSAASGFVGAAAVRLPLAPTLVGLGVMVPGSPAPPRGAGRALEVAGWLSLDDRRGGGVRTSGGEAGTGSGQTIPTNRAREPPVHVALVGGEWDAPDALRLACAAPTGRASVVRAPRYTTGTWTDAAAPQTTASLATCDAPAAPAAGGAPSPSPRGYSVPGLSIGGFTVIAVGLTDPRTSWAGDAYAVVEFEHAQTPSLRGIVLHSGLVPGRVVDVTRAFWRAANARGGFHTASYPRAVAAAVDQWPGTTGAGRGTQGRGEDEANEGEGLGRRLNNALGDDILAGGGGGGGGVGNRGNWMWDADEDDMDVGGAWWHIGGGDDGSGSAPVHVHGAEFRPGRGLVARFGGVPAAQGRSAASAFSASHGAAASAADADVAHAAPTLFSPVAVVPATWISSALVKVEPPSGPAAGPSYRGIPLEVSVNGGVSYSTEVLEYRVEIPV